MRTRHVSSFRFLGVGAFLLASFLVAEAVAAPPIALAPGDAAPQLQGITYPVQRPFLADWSTSKITLVNFWATWCLPCKDEMPLLQELYTRYKDDGLQIIGPFERWEMDRVDAFVKSVGGIDYTLIQPHATTDHYWGGIAVRPISFLINAEGRIMRKYVGASPEQMEGLEVDIAAALAGEPLPLQVPTSGSVLPEEFKQRIEDTRTKKGLSKKP